MKLLRSRDYLSRNLWRYGPQKYIFPKPPTVITKRIMKEIIQLVLTDNMEIRDVAKKYDIPESTVSRIIKGAR